jgi:hypothetical protein
MRAARATDVAVVRSRELGADRWLRYLEPLPDRLR